MTDFELIRRKLNERLHPLDGLDIRSDHHVQAAVTLMLRETPADASVLIIRRAERTGDPWSGHLALPGGRAQREDTDLLVTAARETREEIGVDLLDDGSRARFLGRLPSLAPKNIRIPETEITPFVALAPERIDLRINHEVADAFWISVGELKRVGPSISYSMRFEEIVKTWPAYPSSGGPIWGITERILTNFLSLLD
ncbi:MAG: CoA pyrophosphatase [Acidobacteriota bacterium]|nr:MAG: CoA pyrophosphatase [Acidobacteriota bacterium]